MITGNDLATSEAMPVPPADGRAERPMLSRDADAMYWMARYTERAEHIARLLLVNSNFMIDVGDLAPSLQAQQWQSLLTILRVPSLTEGPDVSLRVQKHLALDHENPNSIVSCITLARENARGIRENISSEMWENLNTLYWMLNSDEARLRFEESPDDLYRKVMTDSMLFQGLTDQTLPHDQRWLFAQLAKYLERVDVTCRIIQIKSEFFKTHEHLFEQTIRNLTWMAVLRSCCSIEAYRRHNLGDMEPSLVVGFLILERHFPRSIRFAVSNALGAMSAIRTSTRGGQIDPAERILGRMDAQLEYAEMAEILVEGVPAYMQKLQTAASEASAAVARSYFMV